MKYFFALLFLLCVLNARGQYYSPFRPGVLAQYSTTAGDTVRTVQLKRQATAGYLGLDSLYDFVPRPRAVAASCGYYRYGNSPLGEALGINNPGTRRAEYWLFGDFDQPTNSYDYLLVLKPYAPLNQPWNAVNLETARVVARTVQPVLGVPDSVVVIAFSGGQQLRLSKFHGLVDGPALACFFGNGPVRRLVLSALPGQRLGQPLLGAMAVYDFQPGNRFVYQYSRVSFPGNPNSPPNLNYLFADSILSRVDSPTRDTVTYRVATYSQLGNTTTVGSVRYTARGTLPGTGPSQRFARTPGPRSGVLLFDGVRSTVYAGNRIVQRTLELDFCRPTPNDTFYLSRPNPDFKVGADYATGLGRVRAYEDNFFAATTSVTLVGYRKGTETWGQLPHMVYGPLAAAGHRPARTTTAFPNPFGAALTVSFQVNRPQAVGLALHDALGRVVLESADVPLPAGTRQLSLATASLPAGVYTLHLRFGEDGRTEVLKVLKAE